MQRKLFCILLFSLFYEMYFFPLLLNKNNLFSPLECFKFYMNFLFYASNNLLHFLYGYCLLLIFLLLLLLGLEKTGTKRVCYQQLCKMVRERLP